MKTYYDAHESAYKSIKAKGYVGWGDVKSLEQLGDAVTEQCLRSSVAEWIPQPAGKTALDLGCGTGTTAFTLAKLGFTVTGVNVSPTAILMAQELATKQDLGIDFKVGDILKLENLAQKFDLIYDSHCFHCIVFDEDRARVLAGVKNSLQDSGKFILDTMIFKEGSNPASRFETLRFDEDFILWHKTNPTEMRGLETIDGQTWCAQRRIYPLEKVLEEILQAGFQILSQQVDYQEGEENGVLRLVCYCPSV